MTYKCAAVNPKFSVEEPSDTDQQLTRVGALELCLAVNPRLLYQQQFSALVKDGDSPLLKREHHSVQVLVALQCSVCGSPMLH